MAQSTSGLPYGGEYPRLSQEQQNLLLQALISRNQQGQLSGYPLATDQTQQASGNPASMSVNPSMLENPKSDNLTNGALGYGNAMFPSFSNGLMGGEPEYNIDLTQTDLGFGDSMGSVSGVSPESDHAEHEKRKKSEEEEDDDDESDGENSPKRRENDDKTAKKPGRKPLTTEPTTKRKAQNRAAQRAFRERKEKHLKDLEQKVVDLEKASESANHENGLLRAQVERLHSELRDYRKRLSLNGTSVGAGTNKAAAGFTDRTNNLSGFQFDFAKFGNAVPFGINTQQLSNSPANANGEGVSRHGSRSLSPQVTNGGANTQSPDISFQNRMNSLSPHSQGSVAGLDGLFSPTILNDINSSSVDYGFPTSNSPSAHSLSNSNMASNNINGGRSIASRQMSLSQSVSNTASPSTSTVSQLGPLSSAGTSPEPMHNSPAMKVNGIPDVTIKTEGEKSFCDKLQDACGDKDDPIPRRRTSADCGCFSASKTPASTTTNDLSFDWLASQNGGQFDPVLFGDYRESQDAIIGGGDFTGGFFDEALPDFESQFLNTSGEYLSPTSPPKQTTLLDQVEKQQNAENLDEVEVVPGDDKRSLMTCHKIWNKLQTCPQFQSGDFDLDSLCSELQTKAKCSETGVVVPKEDVEAALWRLAGAPLSQGNKQPSATTAQTA